MQLLYILLVILTVTRLCGEIAARVRQPALAGELIGGILLGIVARQFEARLPTLSSLPENELFVSVADLGVFFLMLLAGLEMHPRELVKASRSAFLIAMGGMLIPLASGYFLGCWLLPESDWKFAQCLFLAVCMSITAIPVAVKVLMDLGQLKTKTGKLIVSAAVFDDVMGIILLAMLVPMIETGETPGAAALAKTILSIAAFFGITSILGIWVIPTMARWFRSLWVEEIEFSALLVVALAFSLLAEAFHMHFIFGAFMAGLFFSRRTLGTKTFDDVNAKVTAVTDGFLAPIFFVSIGLQLDPAAFWEIPHFVGLLVAVAVGSKLIGAGMVACWVGLSPNKSTAVGVAMSGRGAVELIIAGIALRAGLFDHPTPRPPLIEYLFSAVVIMAIATTLLMPLGLRCCLKPSGRAT